MELNSLPDVFAQFAENPKGGKMAAVAYKHCERLLREAIAALTVGGIEVEVHRAGGMDETIGWRYVIDAARSVWCGEISTDLFSNQDCQDLGDDGWFIVIYDESMPVGDRAKVLAKVPDEDRGKELAETLARAIAGIRAPAPVAVSVDDAKRFAFIVEHNWIGTKTRTERGIADSDIQSARNAVDAALAGKVG